MITNDDSNTNNANNHNNNSNNDNHINNDNDKVLLGAAHTPLRHRPEVRRGVAATQA